MRDIASAVIDGKLYQAMTTPEDDLYVVCKSEANDNLVLAAIGGYCEYNKDDPDYFNPEGLAIVVFDENTSKVLWAEPFPEYDDKKDVRAECNMKAINEKLHERKDIIMSQTGKRNGKMKFEVNQMDTVVQLDAGLRDKTDSVDLGASDYRKITRANAGTFRDVIDSTESNPVVFEATNDNDGLDI